MPIYETIADSVRVSQGSGSGTAPVVDSTMMETHRTEIPWSDPEELGEWLVRHDAFVADSVLEQPDSTSVAVFGARSVLAESSVARTSGVTPLASGPVYQVSVVALLLAYTLLLYRFRSDISSIFVRHKTQPDDQVAEGLSSIYTRFFNSAFTVGLLTAGVMVVKFVDVMAGEAFDAPYWLVLGAVPLVACMLLLVVGVQSSMLWAVGRQTLCDGFIRQLMRLKRGGFTLFTVVCTPLILLYALGPRDSYDAFMYVIGIELVALVLVFLYKTYALFVDKKISILHWFLYLCSVELFPVSLIVLLIFRKS